MNRKQILLYIVVAIVICFVIIPLIVNWLFKQSAPIPMLEAEWEAGEVLGYVSGILSFVGTMFLGWVSWKQNQNLQEKQDDTFIAENSCTVLLGNVNFKIGQQNACNLHIHPETIACSDALSDNDYNCKSFECEVTLQHLKNIPVAVRVLNASILVANQPLEFTKYDDCFTRVAAFKEYSKFNLTLLLPEKEKRIAGSYINEGKYPITLEVKFEIVSDRNVATTLKCRSTLRYCEAENEVKYTSSDDTSMRFGYGSRILMELEIKYRVKESGGAT